jgi:hypothetical protein
MKTLLLITSLIISLNSSIALAQRSEVLMGMTHDRQGITFQVASGGCTSKDNFEMRILETYPAQLDLVKIVPDYCEAFFAYGTKVFFSYEELGLKSGDRFIISNHISKDIIIL